MCAFSKRLSSHQQTMRRVRVTSDNRPTAAALSNQIPVLRSYIDVLVDVSVINQTVLKFELCHETMLSPAGVAEREPTDLLNKRKCLEYLAALRHAKWFQVNSSLKYFFFFPLLQYSVVNYDHVCFSSTDQILIPIVCFSPKRYLTCLTAFISFHSLRLVPTGCSPA